jgi:hypothetical protein
MRGSGASAQPSPAVLLQTLETLKNPAVWAEFEVLLMARCMSVLMDANLHHRRTPDHMNACHSRLECQVTRMAST